MPDQQQVIEEAARLEEAEEAAHDDPGQEATAPSVDAQAADQVPPQPGPGSTATEESAQPAQAAPLFGKSKNKAKGNKKKGPAYVDKGWSDKSIKYLCTAYGASDVMETIGSTDSAPADVKKAHDLMVAGNYWTTVTAGIPAGHNMARRTRAALYHVIDSNAVDVTEAKRLFQIRFQHAAVDSGGTWTYDNVRLVWKQLDVLPDADVTQNTALATFQAIAGTGAFGPSWENKAVNTIQMGESRSADAIPHAVRHEVGHAVHSDKLMGVVNQWLQNEVNVWFDQGNAAGIENWLSNIADFPDKWKDAKGAKKAFTATEKAKVVAMVQSFLGGGSSWNPARATVDTGQPADDAALWKSMPAKMTNAPVQSPGYWYKNWKSFQKGKDGKRYFLNYWYARPFYFGSTADTIIKATGDDYTAMSEKEFFANCYAEYFENPEGINDSKKWGGKLPGDVKTFFDQMIVHQEPYKSAKDRKKNT